MCLFRTALSLWASMDLVGRSLGSWQSKMTKICTHLSPYPRPAAFIVAYPSLAFHSPRPHRRRASQAPCVVQYFDLSTLNAARSPPSSFYPQLFRVLCRPVCLWCKYPRTGRLGRHHPLNCTYRALFDVLRCLFRQIHMGPEVADGVAGG